MTPVFAQLAEFTEQSACLFPSQFTKKSKRFVPFMILQSADLSLSQITIVYKQESKFVFHALEGKILWK